MTCGEVREELSALLDGELAPELRNAVEAHIAACSDCLRELDALKRIDGLYRELPRQSAPPGFEESVRTTIHSIARPVLSLRVSRRIVPLVAVAAMLLVVLGMGVLLSPQHKGALTTASLANKDQLKKEQHADRAEKAVGISKEDAGQLKALGYLGKQAEPSVPPAAAQAAPPVPKQETAVSTHAVIEPDAVREPMPASEAAKPAPAPSAFKSKILSDAQDGAADQNGNAISQESAGAPAEDLTAKESGPIRASRNAARSYLEKGDALLAEGKLDAAVRCYRSAVSLAPQNVEALTKLGDLLLQQGKKEEALGRFTQAAHLEPSNTAALCGLGQAYELMGRTGDAVQQFRKALEADPNCAAAKAGLERTRAKP